MAVDSADNVYVVDSGNHRIQKFGASGSFVTAWGSSGSGSGQFNQPFGVAVDSLDNVYVTDTGNDRVQKFDRNGVFITSWGSTGQGDGQFGSPRAIAVLITGGDLSDSVYVADADSRIQMFGPGGTYAVEFGGDGQTDGQFNGIDGMGFWEGFLVVADSGNHRVQESWYDGNFIVKWGIFGRDEGRFNRPAGIAGTDGVVYVVDPGNNRIQAFGSPLPPLYYLDLNSLGFILSWAGIQAVESGGLGCALPADTDQNVYWDSTYSLTLSGRELLRLRERRVPGVGHDLRRQWADRLRTVRPCLAVELTRSRYGRHGGSRPSRELLRERRPHVPGGDTARGDAGAADHAGQQRRPDRRRHRRRGRVFHHQPALSRAAAGRISF